MPKSSLWTSPKALALALAVIIGMGWILFWDWRPLCEPCLSNTNCPPCISRQQYALVGSVGVLGFVLLARIGVLLRHSSSPSLRSLVSTFTVEDAFYITGRGWVLAGELVGEVARGNRLIVPGAELLITSVEAINKQGGHKTGLFVAQSFTSRHELIEQHIIGAIAQVIA